MPVAWSSGWLLQQMIDLDANQDEWWKQGTPLSIFDPDPDEDPWWGDDGLPVDWQGLPWHEQDEEM